MSSYQECIAYLKCIAKVSNYSKKGHCQKLDICSREFGFKNYHDFKHTFPKFSLDRKGHVYSKIARKYCQVAEPNPNIKYYFFTAYESQDYSYYSHWIGWDKMGKEVRAPSLIKAKQIVDIFRESSDKKDIIYVIDTSMQYIQWFCNWYGKAVISQNIAEQFFSSAFNQKGRVCKDVDIELVKARIEDSQEKLLVNLDRLLL